LLLDHLFKQPDLLASHENVKQALVGLASNALDAESEHFQNWLDRSLEAAGERLKELIETRLESLDTFIEGLELETGEDGKPVAARSPREMADELSGLLQLPIKLSPEQARLLRDDAEKARAAIIPIIETSLLSLMLKNQVFAVKRRLSDSLNITLPETASLDWDHAVEEILAQAKEFIDAHRDRLVRAEDGLIVRDLDAALGRLNGDLNETSLLKLLSTMAVGSRIVFDKKSHRRRSAQTLRLRYIFLAAHLLESHDSETITQDVLDHLEKAQAAIRQYWGEAYWPRIAPLTLGDLDEAMRQGIENLDLPSERIEALRSQPLESLTGEDQQHVIHELGRQKLTEVYRPLLVGVISELWVEYLTQMEALRVSIGLEAYAQRDPLVQYKSKASELFQSLLNDMRTGVVSRMFTYRPRDQFALQASQAPSRRQAEEQEAPGDDEQDESQLSEVVSEAQAEEEDETSETEDISPASVSGSSSLSRSQKRRRKRR
jgi:preprotein translocase subunit SecA